MKEMINFINFNKKRLDYFFFIIGLFLGWFGVYYATRHFYSITGCLCIASLHIHHMYLGILFAILCIPFFLKYKKIYPNRIILLFLIGVFIGFIVDDLFDHFVFKQDAFEIYCGICCSPSNNGECVLP